ncbi:hypothetical protein Taro_035026 [Colocasia esculenta]|uniref:Uncharacterized protein n=1 Tax=Colocasia esculenta TaxID=4460 RepID=A0A843W2K2_COLES|nr:hypothetical protein [Colocasia esculenta]
MVVAANPKAWLSKMRVRGLGHHARDRLSPPDGTGAGGADPRHLGILAFEAGRTMSRLVSLHRGLSESEVARLRCDVMRSQGVAYLNSADQVALVRVACAEMVDDLDATAAAVARFAGRCREGWPRGFDHVYKELKVGKCLAGDISRLGLGLHARDVEKKVKKMEKYAASTSALYMATEELAKLEAAERRLAKCRHWGGASQADVESLQRQISLQRDRARQLREDSLWCRSFDKVAELMARSVISIFARICSVFGASVAELPQVVQGRHGRLEVSPRTIQPRLIHLQYPYSANRAAGISMSGPLERPPVGNVLIRNSGPILRSPAVDDDEAADANAWKEQALAPPPNTLGASGLQLRYAKVVALLDKLASSPELVGEETREELYGLLPEGLRTAVGAKLRGYRRKDDGGGRSDELADGWRGAVEAILGWLAPMADATVQWHSERSFEQQHSGSEPRVLMLQTLMFSDREKAEAAIVEVLVAFSCVCLYGHIGEEDGREF